MTTCLRCDGPLREIPGGYACDACRWEWVTVDDDPGPAPAEVIDPATDGNDIRVPGGMCKAPRREGLGGLTNF